MPTSLRCLGDADKIAEQLDAFALDIRSAPAVEGADLLLPVYTRELGVGLINAIETFFNDSVSWKNASMPRCLPKALELLWARPVFMRRLHDLERSPAILAPQTFALDLFIRPLSYSFQPVAGIDRFTRSAGELFAILFADVLGLTADLWFTTRPRVIVVAKDVAVRRQMYEVSQSGKWWYLDVPSDKFQCESADIVVFIPKDTKAARQRNPCMAPPAAEQLRAWLDRTGREGVLMIIAQPVAMPSSEKLKHIFRAVMGEKLCREIAEHRETDSEFVKFVERYCGVDKEAAAAGRDRTLITELFESGRAAAREARAHESARRLAELLRDQPVLREVEESLLAATEPPFDDGPLREALRRAGEVVPPGDRAVWLSRAAIARLPSAIAAVVDTVSALAEGPTEAGRLDAAEAAVADAEGAAGSVVAAHSKLAEAGAARWAASLGRAACSAAREAEQLMAAAAAATPTSSQDLQRLNADLQLATKKVRNVLQAQDGCYGEENETLSAKLEALAGGSKSILQHCDEAREKAMLEAGLAEAASHGDPAAIQRALEAAEAARAAGVGVSSGLVQRAEARLAARRAELEEARQARRDAEARELLRAAFTSMDPEAIVSTREKIKDWGLAATFAPELDELQLRLKHVTSLAEDRRWAQTARWELVDQMLRNINAPRFILDCRVEEKRSLLKGAVLDPTGAAPQIAANQVKVRKVADALVKARARHPDAYMHFLATLSRTEEEEAEMEAAVRRFEAPLPQNEDEAIEAVEGMTDTELRAELERLGVPVPPDEAAEELGTRLLEAYDALLKRLGGQ